MANNTSLDICLQNRLYDPYDPFSRLVMGLVAAPIILFGWCANSVSTSVFTHRVMRSSPINWYLTVLSCSDFLILISSFFFLSLPRVGELLDIYAAIRLSYTTVPFMYALGIVVQTISVYMTVLMSAHRFVGVCFPFKAGSILTRTRVKIAIGSVLFMGFLVNVTRFFEVRVIADCWAENINYSMPIIHPTSLRLNQTYMMLFGGWFYTIFMFVIPFGMLITMNTKVVIAVHRSRVKHSMAGADAISKRQELHKERSTTIMLLGIVLVFLTCNSLSFIVNILENIMSRHMTREQVRSLMPIYGKMVEMSNLMVTLNASINIFVYCIFSEKYRLLLRHFFCCGWCREGEMLVTSGEH